jgi:hypothetical protein
MPFACGAKNDPICVGFRSTEISAVDIPESGARGKWIHSFRSVDGMSEHPQRRCDIHDKYISA